MKTVAINQLTLAHLRKLDRSVYIATASSILLVSCSLFWMLLRLGGDENTILFSDSAYAFTSLIGAYWAFNTAYMSRNGPVLLTPRHQLAWLFVGVGLLANSLGGVYYTYLEYSHQSPFPSYSDIGFSVFYIFLFIGLLLMPTQLRFRTRMGLDALITTLCLFGVSWFFVLGPVYFASVKQATSVQALLGLFVGLSYPCWDILLILAIALLIQRRTERVLHSSFVLLASGIVAQIWADSGYAYTNTFTHTYSTGTPSIDPFWFIGYMLMGLAGLYQYATIARRVYHEQQQQTQYTPSSSSTSTSRGKNINEVANGAWRQLQNLIIYIPLTFVLLLTIVGEVFYDDTRANVLAVLTAIIGILVAIRYLRATHENEVLLQEREHERLNAEHLRQLSTTLTAILDIEPLLATIPTLATKELGFDAALLILLEAQHQKISPQSYMLINTSSTTTPATKWRLQGDTFFYYLVVSGKDVDVRWDTLAHDVPPDIHVWQREQHIATMNFFPLIDQGETLGSLGLARRTAHKLSPSDISLAKTYVEQVVTIIKHAYLYKEAREQEAFARAMANIAARLNSAVVAPSEIHQLICTEGANALQADYAILYVARDRHGQLEALAAYDGSTDIQGAYNEWPPILPHEDEAQIYHALQPILIRLHEPLIQEVNYGAVSRTGWDTHSSERYAVPPRIREQRRNYSPSLREQLTQHGIDTAIFAPLIAGGNPVGLLVFGRSIPLGTRDRQSFDNETLPLAQDFAEQAAVALTNAHLYQYLRSAHQRMQELDQLKDQFMVTASHELRTPLTAVQGYIELLSQYDAILPTEQRREFLQKASRSCEELVVMLSNVMDASRLEIEAGIRPAFLERTDLYEIVESVITIIEPQVQQEQRIIQVSVPPHTYVLADPIRLRQILMNVSVNALKYSPHRSPLLYSVSALETPGSSFVLSVTDKGKGITKMDQRRLFQRFVRLENDINSSVRGSGLGLYISRRLIEAMGGEIWIESNGIPGEGSTFCVRLPAA